MRIAIADSDPTSADVLAFAAQRRGHRVVTLPSLASLGESLPFDPNVIILGTDLVREAQLVARLRVAVPDVGLFVILERPKEPLPSELLKAGANEVIRAPYNPVEVVVRAENWYGSRRPDQVPDDSLRLADLEIALDRYTATKNGQRMTLTKLELRLLYCLTEHSPHLTPTERLLTFGWDTLGDPDAALIKTHISHIRKKLSDAGGTPFEITARQSLGYMLTVQS
ncbi:MAG: response regulator transcription factor [Dehalococcoidia bacterium]